MCEGGCCVREEGEVSRRRGPVRDEGAEAAGHGGGELASRPPDARGMAGQRPLPDRCARPARPASHIHSLRRVDAQPDPERLAPAAVLTLCRTPHACAGRCRLSSWVKKKPLAARCRCPPLPSTQLPPDASAGSRQPPPGPAACPVRTGPHVRASLAPPAPLGRGAACRRRSERLCAS